MFPRHISCYWRIYARGSIENYKTHSNIIISINAGPVNGLCWTGRDILHTAFYNEFFNAGA